MNKLVKIEKINPSEFGLDENKAAEVESNFLPIISETEQLIPAYNELIAKEISKELIPQAKELRLKFMRLRTATDKIHKTTKAFYLAGGRFVDAWKNKNVTIIESMEEKLSLIENHYINIEKERIKNIEIERLNLIKQYTEILPMGLGQMDQTVFDNYLNGLKVAYEAKIKAEKEAEEKKLAEIEAERQRQIAIEEENKRLKEEAEAKEKELEAEQKKQAEILAKQKSDAEKERKRLEAIVLEEQKKKLEAERLLKEKKEAERKEKERLAKIEQDRIKAEKQAAKAPDKVKLNSFIDSILLPNQPILASEESQKTLDLIQSRFNGFKKWAKDEINLL